MPKRTPTAAITLRRPGQPITDAQLAEAMAPLLALVMADFQDVASLTITHNVVRMQIVPMSRGKRQLDSMLRVSYPIVFTDPDD